MQVRHTDKKVAAGLTLDCVSNSLSILHPDTVSPSVKSTSNHDAETMANSHSQASAGR